MVALGTEAPTFKLPRPGTQELVEFAKGGPFQGYLVMFLSNHCPYVQHIADRLGEVTADYLKEGLAVYGISANDVEAYPADHPRQMVGEAERRNYRFPYLFDEQQAVAKAYDATCTPDFFLFDHSKKLFYRGQFDASRPGNDQPVTGHDLSAAVKALLAGQTPSSNQRPSLGCNIKWRTDTER